MFFFFHYSHKLCRPGAIVHVQLLLSFAVLVHAQGQQRRRIYHATARVGAEIIVHGGLKSDADHNLLYQHDTFLIPLNRDWNNRTLDAPSIASEAPGLLCQALFVDEEQTVYSFGGKLSADGRVKDTQANSFYEDRLPEIWALPQSKSKSSRSWLKLLGKNAAKPMPPNFQQIACGAYAYDVQRAYYMGGLISHWTTFGISNFTQYFGVPGLVSFEFDSRELTNSTNDGQFFGSRFTGLNEKPFQPGPMFDIPFGPDGTLVSFGGLAYPKATEVEYGAGWSNLWIYDKRKITSYNQPLQGDIPPGLGADPETFAFFMAIDEANETVEIFAYGHFNESSQSDTIYILSLPAFRWTKTSFTNYPRRVGMRCQSAGNNQAICTGGANPESTPLWNSTDEWSQGLGVLDKTNLVLKDSYDASAPPYTAPELVRRIYENKDLLPTTWASLEVKETFDNFNHKTPSGQRLSKKTSAIIGIVTPIVFLSLCAGIWWLWRKRHRDKGRKISSEESSRELPLEDINRDIDQPRMQFGGNLQHNNLGGGTQVGQANVENFYHTVNNHYR